MDATGQANDARDRVMGDMKSVIDDAEQLLRGSQQQAGESFLAAKAKLEATLSNARTELVRLEENVVASAREAAVATDQYVKEHPWQSVGLAACVGMIFGLLIARK